MPIKKRKIVIVTGSRGEYGYIRPIIQEIQKSKTLDYEMIVTNLHLLTGFGYSVSDIERDKLKISDRIYMALDGYTPETMSKSLGVALMSLSDALPRLKPDVLLLAGDRGEQLVAAIAAAHMNIPIAHIQAGELSGNIDGMSRHAITRFAHLHFASNADAARRLERMGEEKFRIHLTGAPQLDDLINGVYLSRKEISRKYHLKEDERFLLLVQHSVTEEYGDASSHIKETLEAICALKIKTIVIFPNNDAGSDQVRQVMQRYRREFIEEYRNVQREDYAGLMNMASALVGNSSSALIEAPCFKLPAVNIGNRQRGRMQGNNVINAKNNREDIKGCIKKALSAQFRAKLMKNCENPYFGDGKVGKRVVDILASTPLDERLITKQIVY